jgi:hypothetical protein
VLTKSIAAIALTVLVAFCGSKGASAQAVVAKCAPKFMQIKAKGKHWKAFAVNKPNNNGQACGWTEGFPAKYSASTKALSECQASERDHPTWGVTGTCRIVYLK